MQTNTAGSGTIAALLKAARQKQHQDMGRNVLGWLVALTKASDDSRANIAAIRYDWQDTHAIGSTVLTANEACQHS